MEGAVTVLLCDDAALVRELVRYGLEEDPRLQVVGEAADADTGIRHTWELRPNCILFDLSMPGMDGLEAIPLIRLASPETAIVVFSGFSSARLGPTALARGADRYVQKSDDLDELRRVVLETCAEREATA